ncbi:winged helix-turn-helix domain-containing protein [Sphaerotilus uruguayifluvii]|uniref:Restriction system protein n=1 Tax=Sphaerotilus uruguayifluvii TaxID=2735897 RepID=A0ABX2G735_9BURK|nr:winged helix-turn-helix domain-containing protein [Leptothrix sp. C29]NRT58143.1 restriction system protein [Leptothrix sp. C29]
MTTTTPATLPTYDRFIEPLLRFLAGRPEGAPAREAHEAAADALGLDAAARQQLVPSGAQLIYKNRAGWAHDRLKRAGLSDSPRRGWWQLTEAGRRFVAEHPEPLTRDQVGTLAMSHLDARLRAVAVDVGEDETAAAQPVASPEERLGLALEEIRRSVAAELLDTLATVTPAFFETLVLDLLHRMGYGANRADLQRVGGSGDAGIDRIISLDRLGLEKVYVQAKRWAAQGCP